MQGSARAFKFVAGAAGPWSILSCEAVRGDPLPRAARLQLLRGDAPVSDSTVAWTLRGVTSNERYTARREKELLQARQESLGRAGSTRAALIPVRKTAEWWALPQDERRAILEERSRHIAIGLDYLPAIARRLHHCRDLGDEEPFDFITWFEFAESDAPAFEELVGRLRATEEWTFVEREVDVRLARDGRA